MTAAALMLDALREAHGALTPARLAAVARVSLLEALEIAPRLPGVVSDGIGFRLVRG